MSIYEPGVFAALYNSPVGQRIWAFLNTPETIVRMETATGLERPAVEGIEEPLLTEFGADVLRDRTKQMIGHMVRQIMERSGYTIAVQNVKVTNGGPFSRATRYKLPDEMTFYVFKSSKDSRILALTSDKAGIRLRASKPEPDTRWTYWKSFRGSLRGRIAFGLEDEKKARGDIAAKGFHIYRMPRMLRATR